MPPTGKPDRVPNTWNSKPAWQGHGVVFGSPYASRRNGFLKAEPVGARRTVALPVQARVVGENLEAGADDECHEKQVQEVLDPQPRRKAGGDGQRGVRNARIPQDEILHRRQLPQRLSDCHADDGEYKSDRQGPQHVEPTPANPNLWHHAFLGRQPVAQKNTVVRGSEVRLDGIVWERSGLSVSHTSRFSV